MQRGLALAVLSRNNECVQARPLEASASGAAVLSHPVVRGLLRRARLAAALGGASRCAVFASAAAAILALGLRVFGVAWPLPLEGWPILFVGSALLGGLWTLRSAPLSGAAALAVVDRRAGLGGLLLASAEVSDCDSSWQAELDGRLSRTPARKLPQLWLRPNLQRFALAALFVAIVAWLPEPRVARTVIEQRLGRALAAAVEDTARDVDAALEDGTLSDEQGEELSRRAEGLRERLDNGDAVAWSDVDALRDALRFEQQAGRSGMRSLAAGLAEMQDELREKGGLDAGDLAAARQLMERAAAEGLLDQLPKDLRQLADQLQQSGSGEAGAERGNPGEQSNDPSGERSSGETSGGAMNQGAGAPPNLEQLERLAKALAEAAGQRAAVGQPGSPPPLQPGEIPDLQQLLEQMGASAGAGGADGAEPGEEGSGMQGAAGGAAGPGGQAGGAPGGAGITRGPGSVPLNGTGATDIEAAGSLRPEKLAPGQAIPDRWQVVGSTRASPNADPVRAGESAGGGGSAAAGPTGDGSATWRRSLAPRHRAAIRRFFSESSERR